MSDQYTYTEADRRSEALRQAVEVCGNACGDPTRVLETARQFYAFLSSTETGDV